MKTRFVNFYFTPYVRRLHVYKDVWSTLIGEEPLDCQHEEENEHDENDAEIYRNGLINEFMFGHLPLHFPKAACKFFKLQSTSSSTSFNTKARYSVTGKRVVNKVEGYGLEIPVTYTLRGLQRTINWVKEEVVRELTRTSDMKKKFLK